MNMRHILSVALLCSSAFAYSNEILFTKNADGSFSPVETEEKTKLQKHITEGAKGALVAGGAELINLPAIDRFGNQAKYRGSSIHVRVDKQTYNLNRTLRKTGFGFGTGMLRSYATTYATTEVAPYASDLYAYLYEKSPQFIQNACDCLQPAVETVRPAAETVVIPILAAYIDYRVANLIERGYEAGYQKAANFKFKNPSSSK